MGMMFLLHVGVVLVLRLELVQASKEIFVEKPFYLRARVHDSHAASFFFQIPPDKDQRACQMYKFTIRRNREDPYSMPEQNLTYWRNSLELKYLATGRYRVCAIICSEQMGARPHLSQHPDKKNVSFPIPACVEFQAYRSHFLVLTLYFLVLLFLTLSQITYSLRKRKIRARVKLTLMEVENSLQNWRSAQRNLSSAEHTPSYSILHSIVHLPASPVEHSLSSPGTLTTTNDHPQTSPVVHFQLEAPDETFTSISERHWRREQEVLRYSVAPSRFSRSIYMSIVPFVHIQRNKNTNKEELEAIQLIILVVHWIQ